MRTTNINNCLFSACKARHNLELQQMKQRTECECGMEFILSTYTPWRHADDCPVRLRWNEYEHAREIEQKDERAERRETN